MSGRDDVLEIVKRSREQDSLKCPICRVGVKAKNLLRHYDKQHPGQDLPPNALTRASSDGAAGSAPVPRTAPLISSDGSPDCQELLELASADLYRTNLFRVIGLGVDDSAADVRRRQARLEMQRKLNLDGPVSHQGPLALDPAPDSEVESRAMQRLADPEARLMDELFWFWPLQAGEPSDDALRALDNSRLDDAVEIWRRGRGNGTVGLAIHNLAVLTHLRALDAEFEGRGTEAQEEWKEALQLWGEVVQGEEFWSALRGRIGSLNDQKISSGLARRIRVTLPKMLLLINVRIAIQAAECGDLDTAKRHTALVESANYGEDLVHEVRGEAIRPLRRRLSNAIEIATERWEAEPHLGCDVVREFMGQAKKILDVIDALLPYGNHQRTGLHDLVADTILRGQVAYGNKTNDYSTSIQLLRAARGIAEGDATRAKLDEQLGVLAELEGAGNDWCSPGYWELPEDVIEKLEAARANANAGEFDSAIRELLELQHLGLGRPLRRCLAYCLSLKGILINNQAQADFDGITSVLRRVIEREASRVRERTASGLGSILARLESTDAPMPHMSSWQLPPCGCGHTYSSWVNFNFDGMSLWMCSTCSTEHDAELERSKSTLRSKIKQALQHLILADDLDPREKGVRRNLKAVMSVAEDLGMRSTLSSRGLRRELGIDLKVLQGGPSDPARTGAPWRPSLWQAAGIGAVVGAAAFGALHLLPARSGSGNLAGLLYDWARPLVEELTDTGAPNVVKGTCASCFVAAGALLGTLWGITCRGGKS